MKHTTLWAVCREVVAMIAICALKTISAVMVNAVAPHSLAKRVKIAMGKATS